MCGIERYLFLQMMNSIRKCRSVHLLVRFAVTISVSVHALVADVVLHASLSVLHELLHLDQVDSGGVRGAVGPPERQVLGSGLVPDTAGGVPLVVPQGWGPGLAQVQGGVDAVSGPPAGPRLLPPGTVAGARDWAGPATVLVGLGEGTALVTVRHLVAGHLAVPLVGGGGGRVPRPPPVAVGEVGGGAGDAHSRRQLVAGGQASHLQTLRGFDETGELGLGHRGLALVHEVQDALHLPAAHVLQDHDGVLPGIVDEYFLEVRTAGGEYDLVGPHGGVLAHDGAVHQRLILGENNDEFLL